VIVELEVTHVHVDEMQQAKWRCLRAVVFNQIHKWRISCQSHSGQTLLSDVHALLLLMLGDGYFQQFSSSSYTTQLLLPRC
jgi:hypothetical protein